MSGNSQLNITINGIDNASGIFGGIKGSAKDLQGGLSSLGETITVGLGDALKVSLVAAAGIATAAIGTLGAALAISMKEAMDAEVNMAMLDATLRAVGASATQQASEWAAAQGQFVVSGKLSEDEVTKLIDKNDALKNKIQDLNFAIHSQEVQLDRTKNAKIVDTLAVETHQYALQKLKRELEKTTSEMENMGLAISDGSQRIKTDLATALGLVQPLAMMTREELVKLSMSLRDLAGGSDDAVLGVETILLRMGVAKDVFPQATKAILDASAALGTDLHTTAQMVGKTLVAPGEGLMRLKAIGATFTDSQEKMIKNLVATGKAAEAQKVILDALAKTTEGAAEAKAKTLSGQLTILRNHLLEVAEGVGTQLLPIFENLAKQVFPVVEKIVGQIGENFGYLVPLFLRLAESGGKLISEILRLAGIDLSESGLESFVSLATGKIANLITEATNFTNWLTANLAPALAEAQTRFAPLIAAFQNLGSALIEKSPQIQAALMVVGNVISDTFGLVAPKVIESLSGAINGLAEIWRKHGDTVIAVLTTAFSVIAATVGGAIGFIAGILNAAVTWFGGIFDTISLIMQGKWSEAFAMIMVTTANSFAIVLGAFDIFGNSILGLLGTNMDELRNTWQTNWNMVQLIVSTVWTNIQNAIAQKIIEIVNSIRKFITDTIALINSYKDTFIGLGSSLMNWLLEGVRSATAAVIDAVRSAVGRAVTSAQEMFPMGMNVVGPNLQGRDSGGPGEAGQAYLIGRGAQPEMFIPKSDGYFVPNADKLGGGVSNTTNIYLTANYANAQSEASLRDDVALLQMMAA